MITDLTKSIAQALVDYPDTVSVTSIDDDYTSIIRIRVGKGETGKLIGKQGRTVEALRTILKAIASRTRKRVFLEIENETEKYSAPAGTRSNILKMERRV